MSHKPTYEELEQRILELEQAEYDHEHPERELLKSEEHLSSIFRSAPVGIGLVINRILQKANYRLCEITGYDEGELIGQSSRILYASDKDFEFVGLEKYAQIKKCGTGTVETHWRKKDGTLIDVLLSSTPLDLQDLSKGVTFTALDITERKQMEEALRVSEERLGETTRIAKVGGWEIDLGNNALVWSKETFRIHELAPDYQPGVDEAIQFYHPDDRAKVVTAVQLAVENGQGYDFEARLITAKKNLCWVRAIGKPFYNDGQLAGIRGMVQDITEQKRIEEALRQSEAYLKAVMDNLPIGVAVNSIDPEVAFSFMNDNFPKFYRTTRDALAKPDSFWEAVYEDPLFREEMRKSVLADCSSGDPKRMYWEDVPITRQGKETAFINARNTQVPGQNLMISTVWDVTERKQAEKERQTLQEQLAQVQKIESIGRLAGGIAHDFNNMLVVILGHTEMILEQMRPTEPNYNELQEVQKAARRSAEITRQLLAFARKQTIAPQILDLNKTVGGMLQMLRRLIGEDIDLNWLPASDLAWIKIDPTQIDQILANLCVNARDAITGTGKITIETGNAFFDEDYCITHTGYVPGDYVLLSVGDNGCGIDHQIMDHLFEPFFTTKEVDKGTGLGLSTVYGIVKQNNGFINVYSELGHGTNVNIYFPQHQSKQKSSPDIPKDQSAQGGKEIILLVEDEPSILDMTKMMLEKLGYQVIPAKTPGEAIELANRHAGDIHLLLSDVVMPEMNGRELARNILSLYPDIKRLFMSGYTANVIAHHGILDEGINFIQKPFSLKTISCKVREVLDKKF